MDPKTLNVLEQSTREGSTASALNEEPTSGIRKNDGPSAEHLDPPTDTSQATSQQTTAENSTDPSGRLLDRSRPNYSAIGVVVPANGWTVGPEENEQEVESRMDRCLNTLNRIWEWYKYTAIDFRDSCFFYLVYYIISYLPISGIIAGLVYLKDCPQFSYMPIFEIVLGFASLIILFVWSIAACAEQNETPFSRWMKILLQILCTLLSFAIFAELLLICLIHPSFESTSKDYCNKTFYHYLIGKEIASALVAVLAFLISFPGSGLHNFCQDCPPLIFWCSYPVDF